MIKVIHLLNHLEKIERDLIEIEELKGRLEQGRTYTSRVRKSLEEETLRLRELRGTIGRLVVRKVSSEVLEDFKNFLTKNPKQKPPPISQKAVAEPVRIPPKVDIILPTRNAAPPKSPSEKASAEALPSNRKSPQQTSLGKNSGTPKKAQKSREQAKMRSGEKEDPPFRWKFVQN